MEDVIEIHRAWCDHVAATLLLFPNTNISSHLIDNPDHGSLGINAEQIVHYKLQLLFRALIIIDIHAGEEGTEQKFQLVYTDITS